MRILRPPNKSMAYDAINWKIGRYLKRYFCWFSRLRKCPTRRISRRNHINWLWTSINKALSVSLFKEEQKKQPRKFYSFILTCWFFHLFSLRFTFSVHSLTHSFSLIYQEIDAACNENIIFFLALFSTVFFSLQSCLFSNETNVSNVKSIYTVNFTASLLKTCVRIKQYCVCERET